MLNPSRFVLALALPLLAFQSPLAGTSAFERAPRDSQGRVMVENLIIGCSTDPAIQEQVAKLPYVGQS